uniref:Headcase N-terminal domain-containing protein n=1 Tax=Panagrolaimus davidi TaxID=227884 RepID=A0A914PTH4_9BILA
MRDKKFIKGEQQKVKKQKKQVCLCSKHFIDSIFCRELDAKINQDDGIVRDRNGETMCCVPFMKCTRVGLDLPKSLADGIKMCCTNPDCAYAKNLIHPECFRSLEQNLMTIITSKGYDKSLSEKLRISEERLWGKKGLALLQKNLRCACGKGQMTRDNDAWEEREVCLFFFVVF